MTLQYAFTEEDYLQHQLFVASQSPYIKKQRRQTWILLSVSCFIIGLLFHENDNSVMAWYFLIFGILALCFYPMYQKGYYKRHYQKYMAEHFSNKLGKAVTIVIENEYISTSDSTAEFKASITELEGIEETGDYIYLKIKAGGHLIIPKSQLSDVAAVRQYLKVICEKLGVTYTENLQWKWK